MPEGKAGQKKKASKNQVLNAVSLHMGIARMRNPCFLKNFPAEIIRYQSSEIAPTGHAPAQEPQLMHAPGSISNLPSPALIAPTGHCPAQEPQLIQESPITYAIILSSFINVGYLVL